MQIRLESDNSHTPCGDVHGVGCRHIGSSSVCNTVLIICILCLGTLAGRVARPDQLCGSRSLGSKARRHCQTNRNSSTGFERTLKAAGRAFTLYRHMHDAML